MNGVVRDEYLSFNVTFLTVTCTWTSSAQPSLINVLIIETYLFIIGSKRLLNLFERICREVGKKHNILV